MLPFRGTTVIGFLVRSLLKFYPSSKIAVLIPDTPSDDDLNTHIVKDLGMQTIRGSELDVHSRFLKAFNILDNQYCVRLTADNPLIDVKLIKLFEDIFVSNNYDFMSSRVMRECSIISRALPKGLSIDIFSKDALLDSRQHCKSFCDLEHVIPPLYVSAQRSYFPAADWVESNFEFIDVDKNYSIDTYEEYSQLNE